MNLVSYEPWSVFNKMGRLYDDVHGGRVNASSGERVRNRWSPAVDIREEDNEYVIHADLPGVSPEDIEVTADNGQLVIKGSRDGESTQEHAGYKRVERARGEFYRSFSLPELVDGERIEASSADGVLTVVIPKIEKAQPRRIPVS